MARKTGKMKLVGDEQSRRNHNRRHTTNQEAAHVDVGTTSRRDGIVSGEGGEHLCVPRHWGVMDEVIAKENECTRHHHQANKHHSNDYDKDLQDVKINTSVVNWRRISEIGAR